MTEQAIIKQSLNGMAQIINAIPGETYANKEAETLLIMQHRLPESDLKKQIEIYNAIFAKQGGASISDITDSAIAYVKIKVLSEAELLDFDATSLRDLIKELIRPQISLGFQRRICLLRMNFRRKKSKRQQRRMRHLFRLWKK